MGKKSFLTVCLILVMPFFLLGSCQKQPQKETLHDPGKITIGVVVWPGYLPLYVAREKGFFREEGLDVEIKTYTSQAECSRDYVAGKLQGRANLTSEAINESLQGLDHKVVLVIDYSNGSDGIAAKAGIESFPQGKGKKVAFEQGTLEEYFLQHALDQNKMSLKDFVPINLDPENAAKALIEGAVDIAVTYEPYLSAAIKQINGKKIYSSADAPGVITDILTFHRSFVDAHPESVAAIVRTYFKAFHFWKENPDEAHAIVGKVFGNTKEEIAEQLKGIALLDEKDNKIALTFSVGTQSLYGNMRRVSEFILRHQGKKELVLDTDRMIEKKFVKNLQEKK